MPEDVARRCARSPGDDLAPCSRRVPRGLSAGCGSRRRCRGVGAHLVGSLRDHRWGGVGPGSHPFRSPSSTPDPSAWSWGMPWSPVSRWLPPALRSRRLLIMSESVVPQPMSRSTWTPWSTCDVGPDREGLSPDGVGVGDQADPRVARWGDRPAGAGADGEPRDRPPGGTRGELIADALASGGGVDVAAPPGFAGPGERVGRAAPDTSGRRGAGAGPRTRSGRRCPCGSGDAGDGGVTR